MPFVLSLGPILLAAQSAPAKAAAQPCAPAVGPFAAEIVTSLVDGQWQ